MQAVAKATARQSFVVTTGTGSGKSLCFFIPIIDAAIRARASAEERRTRAIVIYPMNALANSQREELNKFLDQSGLPENLRPTFARYTGLKLHRFISGAGQSWLDGCHRARSFDHLPQRRSGTIWHFTQCKWIIFIEASDHMICGVLKISIPEWHKITWEVKRLKTCIPSAADVSSLA